MTHKVLWVSDPSAEVGGANLSFYRPSQLESFPAVAEPWWLDPRASCTHPRWARLYGYEEILSSWNMLFRAKTPFSLVLSEEHFDVGSYLGWCTLSENLVTKTGVPVATSATDTFIRDDTGQCKTAGYHASAMTRRR